jgi:hypothetical protein
LSRIFDAYLHARRDGNSLGSSGTYTFFVASQGSL